MCKVGICFPIKDYNTMDFEQFKKYLNKFKQAGIHSFDFYTSMFLQNDNKLKSLITYLKQENIKFTFHYNCSGIIGYNNLLEQYKADLTRVRNVLKTHDINYETTIVFHALKYNTEFEKYNHLLNQIEVFNSLCEFAKDLNFKILIETLSHNHPVGNHIGDDIDELEFLLTNINSNNFGICWDMGHTRLNHIEKNTPIGLTKKIISSVKFTHIHNFAISNKQTIDHLPFSNFELQKEEINHLIKNGYKGIYSIEIPTINLKENVLIYIDNIVNLKNMIKDMEDENERFNNIIC